MSPSSAFRSDVLPRLNSQNGDPELGSDPGGADIIDWVELIPFPETRNYVQRVSENITIYRAKLTGSADSPIAPWLSK